jgi:hypothetical protein
MTINELVVRLFEEHGDWLVLDDLSYNDDIFFHVFKNKRIIGAVTVKTTNPDEMCLFNASYGDAYVNLKNFTKEEVKMKIKKVFL